MRARQNRVTPEGEIIAHPARGTLMGNRGGRLHRDDGTLGPARWRSTRWIACRLEFRGRQRRIMGAGYTELFFLDEVTAAAAGHRPCAECRHAEFTAFCALWAEVFNGTSRAAGIDATLHAARVCRNRTRVTFEAGASDLPDRTMIRTATGPALLLGRTLLPWAPAGYGAPGPRPSGRVTVLTPEPLVRLIVAGWRPALHPSAAPHSSV